MMWKKIYLVKDLEDVGGQHVDYICSTHIECQK